MKKNLLIIAVLVASWSLTAQPSGQIHNLGSDMHIMGISPNGKYVVGYDIFKTSALLWTEDSTKIIRPDGGCTALAVSDNGVLVGQFLDSAVMYESWDGTRYLFNAGYYKDNQWHGLGVRPELEIDDAYASLANAISADGSIIGGGMYSTSVLMFPTLWKNETPENVEFEEQAGGGRILGLSADGRVACGWVRPYLSRVPAVWIDGELKVLTYNGQNFDGECNDVSPNGRYVALTFNYKAAIYDVLQDELIIIGQKYPNQQTNAMAVSDDGIVVGYHQVDFLFGREGFIYSEGIGMQNINDYLVTIGVPGAGTASLNCLMDISADGLRIVGFSSNFEGFAIDIDAHLTGYNPPRNLKAVENIYRNISLTWEVPHNDPNNTLSGYDLYRNDTKVNSSLITATNYLDNITSDGTYSYIVKAVWNGNEESLPTAACTINSGKLNIPFLEDFSSDWNANYWNGSSEWKILEYLGMIPPGLNYDNLGDIHTDTFLSAFIDASTADELFLSFNIGIPISNDGSILSDTFRVEIYDGSNWHLVDEFFPLLQGVQSFEYKKYDISTIAANKTIRARLTCSGVIPGLRLHWWMDNIHFYTSEDELLVEVPVCVNAHKSEDGTVHVNWADPKRVATLSYIEIPEVIDGIGNEGAPFISGAKFEANDLKGYDQFSLESISAFINESATFKLVIFSGAEKIVEQDINTYEINAWNTFPLNQPIIIDKDNVKDLYFGIEVVSHAANQLPLGVFERLLVDMENEIFAFEGRANLYSVDNGQTWGTLTEFGLPWACGVMANLVGEQNAQQKERLMGYKIYRDGINILGHDEHSGSDYLTILNNFTDIDPIEGRNVCYQVTAYYDIQEESDDAEFCFYVPVSIKEMDNYQNKYVVYPNPTNNMIHIEGEFDYVVMYSIEGKLLLNASTSTIDLNSYPNGMYFLKIHSKDGIPVTKRIIKD